MSNLQLAPFNNRRQALYCDLPAPGTALRRPSANLGLPAINSRGADPMMSSPLTCLSSYRDVDPRMAVGPLRRMPPQRSTPFYEDYGTPSSSGSGGNCNMYMKPRAMSYPHVHPHYHEPMYPSYPQMSCSNHGPSNSCSSNNLNSNSNSNSNNKSNNNTPTNLNANPDAKSTANKDATSPSGGSLSFLTKNITLRGKIYSLRSSYLLESPKFEAELQKLADKKKESIIPTAVFVHLISYINSETYCNTKVIDEVTLNIVCSTLGCKSCGDFSLGQLNKWAKGGEGEVGSWEEMVGICVLVLCSEKVEEKLKEWLKGYLKGEGGKDGGKGKVGERVVGLLGSRAWADTMGGRPEVETRLLVLLGLRGKEEEGEYRII
ncbi:hypothetical protein BJ875DRAFT_486364 [Amylocarpus encephaloides]|uniref:BTB domain-containing protein n=1 Tax=Amylocarpus encephaloides TaxID=45428 RepID=A0A9P7YFB4_9HELO|nr:hypothetical protein BJ875DRAFT_486364 [Amylocarpus encephaloides]